MHPENQGLSRSYPIGLTTTPDTGSAFRTNRKCPKGLTGGTKHVSDNVIKAFFKGCFVDMHAKAYTDYRSSMSLGWRVVQILTVDTPDINLYFVYKNLRRAKTINFTITDLLTPKRKIVSYSRKIACRMLCLNLIERFGSKRRVAQRFNLNIEILNLWI
jgi:hypothetical protein